MKNKFKNEVNPLEILRFLWNNKILLSLALIIFSTEDEPIEVKPKFDIKPEDKEKFELLLNMLNDIEDVSNIYHNVEL